ncbi:lipopolysaccharide biosynthesis protein [Nitrosomonas sp.]|uniref:lipopolysaccharide biosynthesis protein n=1 Tax=Nitrosomonas sp. TaxID=42353 RepID=UPI0027317F21|nr:oligosaccharide flippase family protein [Nitrosomonas sp.]MDP1788084.1 oligosaccharide flippase family protein [Nitrosomonas sp.]
MSVSPYSSAILKRGAVHFLVGKAASALLSLITLLWLVRLLAVEEYGAYVVLIAGMEITLAITSLGSPWVAARYLPEFRLYSSGKMLIQFVWQLIALNTLFLVIGALLLLMAIPWLLEFLDLAQYTDAARLYLLVLIIEGSVRRIRENILGTLLQQKQAQISLVTRNLALLLLLGIASNDGAVNLHFVVLAEFVASAVGGVLALHGLIQYMLKHCDLLGSDSWLPPKWSKMCGIACQMYFNQLVSLIYSPQVFVFLIQRYLGAEATALFGFLRSLYVQIASYLPATLLFSLIRPKLIASYVGTGGMAELSNNANLVGKLSLFVLMPVLIFTWIAGTELLDLLSGGKFGQVNNYLAGLLLALIPLSQYQILTTVAVACDRSHLCFLGASLGMLSLPAAYWLLESGYGVWSIIIAIVMSQALCNAMIIFSLTRATTYMPDTFGFFKLVIAALISFILTQQLMMEVHGWLGLLIIAVSVVIFYLLSAYFIRPFRTEERTRINRVLNREIFVW